TPLTATLTGPSAALGGTWTWSTVAVAPTTGAMIRRFSGPVNVTRLFTAVGLKFDPFTVTMAPILALAGVITVVLGAGGAVTVPEVVGASPSSSCPAAACVA